MMHQTPSGSHPGYMSPRLADMRRVLDEEPLSDKQRRLVQRALADIEGDWKNSHTDAYERGLAARDEQHDEVLEVAGMFCSQISDAHEDVRHGRKSAAEVRAWLRDVRADFEKLTQQHRGIEASEDSLAQLEAMDLDDYQEQQFTRFPLVRQGAPTLNSKLQTIASRREAPRFSALSKAQMDADQDELQRVLRRELGRR
ncbi:hypothetical protein [Pseudonocardia alaniniphila]|uniref:Uncharacterized protein n=1 Tax=Pseudonocardia alaniniphila TaxID=75291 RepID=A0ABS9T9U6_9PSEU|nr:hypothetical protein [Pseudonocardia alaniniphila]MCH6165314.1 hypothetical protein [Pseudonocardia alaniniphila]